MVNKFQVKLEKYADKIIKDSFPDLIDIKIKIFELKVSNLYGLFIYPKFIGINPACEFFTRKEIFAIIVHELCHVEIFKKYGVFKSLRIYFLYWFLPSLRKKEEIKTNKLVIEKGYVRGLILLSKRLSKKYPELKGKTYSSPEEIKSYAKEIGKW